MKVNISTVDGMKEVEVEEFIEIGGKKCFVHKETWDNNGSEGFAWKVSEYRSGWFFGYAGTKKEAIARAKERVRTRGIARFFDVIDKAIEKTGVANS